jgi:hypothetical protein
MSCVVVAGAKLSLGRAAFMKLRTALSAEKANSVADATRKKAKCFVVVSGVADFVTFVSIGSVAMVLK